MILQSKQILHSELSTEIIIERLDAITDDWERDGSTKTFVGKIDGGSFRIKPLIPADSRNKLYPELIGYCDEEDGHTYLYLTFQPPQIQRILILLSLWTVPIVVFFYFLNYPFLSHLHFLFFPLFYIIALFVMYIEYSNKVDECRSILKGLLQ